MKEKKLPLSKLDNSDILAEYTSSIFENKPKRTTILENEILRRMAFYKFIVKYERKPKKKLSKKK